MLPSNHKKSSQYSSKFPLPPYHEKIKHDKARGQNQHLQMYFNGYCCLYLTVANLSTVVWLSFNFSPGSVWLKGHWMNCNASCGGGYQHRPVFCYQRGHHRPDSMCERTEPKPRELKVCNTDRPCTSQWVTGPWGEVSGWPLESFWRFCRT